MLHGVPVRAFDVAGGRKTTVIHPGDCRQGVSPPTLRSSASWIQPILCSVESEAARRRSASQLPRRLGGRRRFASTAHPPRYSRCNPLMDDSPKAVRNVMP